MLTGCQRGVSARTEPMFSKRASLSQPSWSLKEIGNSTDLLYTYAEIVSLAPPCMRTNCVWRHMRNDVEQYDWYCWLVQKAVGLVSSHNDFLIKACHQAKNCTAVTLRCLSGVKTGVLVGSRQTNQSLKLLRWLQAASATKKSVGWRYLGEWQLLLGLRDRSHGKTLCKGEATFLTLRC